MAFLVHFSIILHFIFPEIETQNERKINVKWNPNLASAKIDSKNYHFHFFGSVYISCICVCVWTWVMREKELQKIL